MIDRCGARPDSTCWCFVEFIQNTTVSRRRRRRGPVYVYLNATTFTRWRFIVQMKQPKADTLFVIRLEPVGEAIFLPERIKDEPPCIDCNEASAIHIKDIGRSGDNFSFFSGYPVTEPGELPRAVTTFGEAQPSLRLTQRYLLRRLGLRASQSAPALFCLERSLRRGRAPSPQR